MSETKGKKLEFRHVAGEKGQSALDRYDPVRLGFLGAEMTGVEKAYRKIHQLAFDQAKEAGRDRWAVGGRRATDPFADAAEDGVPRPDSSVIEA